MKKIIYTFLFFSNIHGINVDMLLSNITESDLIEFAQIYKERPIKNNDGGMKAVGMFWVWYMVRHINPEIIVEVGIWKGQSTWLLEQAAPNARIIAFDPSLHLRRYISDNVEYHSDDFSTMDFGDISNKTTLVFFDDHQDAFKRLKKSAEFGFKHILFDDNYPVGAGSHLTLQHCLEDEKYEKLSDELHMLIKKYTILPQLVGDTTRTGYPTQNHVVETLNFDPKGPLKIYQDDALSYRWTTYVAL